MKFHLWVSCSRSMEKEKPSKREVSFRHRFYLLSSVCFTGCEDESRTNYRPLENPSDEEWCESKSRKRKITTKSTTGQRKKARKSREIAARPKKPKKLRMLKKSGFETLSQCERLKAATKRLPQSKIRSEVEPVRLMLCLSNLAISCCVDGAAYNNICSVLHERCGKSNLLRNI